MMTIMLEMTFFPHVVFVLAEVEKKNLENLHFYSAITTK